MTISFSSVLLAGLQCVMLTYSVWTLDIVNRSYGPAMCRELCQKYNATFSFMKEYHCRYISPKDSKTRGKQSTGDSFTCFVKGTITNGSSIWSVMTARNICKMDTKGIGIKSTKDLEVLQHNLNVALHQACEDGDLCMIKYILTQKHADINTRGKCRRTPIMVAAGKAQVDIFYFLLSRGSDLSIVDAANNTVLHAASLGGSTDIVKKLLVNREIDVDRRGEEGWTAAMYAAERGQKDVLDLLVNKGCNMKAVSNDKQNILHVACMGGHVDIVKYILSEGFNIESRGFAGRTPVMIAAEMGHIEVVELLVDRGCNVSAKDNHSNNILHFACKGGHVDMVKYILSEHTIPLDCRGHSGKTPVMRAAENGHIEVVNLLVNRGCNVSAADQYSNNILHLACMGGHVNIVKYILSENIKDIESPGFLRRTPVMMAAEKGIKEVFEFLEDEGCNLGAKDNHLNNILHIACIGGHVNMVRYILSKSITGIESRDFEGRTSVMMAAEKGIKDVFELLEDKGCNLRAKCKYSNNILHFACIGGHLNMVKYILSKHIVPLESRGHSGKTPVMRAVENGHRKVFDTLVREGCSLDTLDSRNNNILHLACVGGHVGMVKHILSKRLSRLNIESKGFRGRTPVMFAAQWGKAQVFALLVNNGCNLEVVDDYGNNVLHMACVGGNVDVVRYLIKFDIVLGMQKNKNRQTPKQLAEAVGRTAILHFLKAMT